MTSLPFLLDLDRGSWRDVRVKSQPEDFVVEEVGLYEPGGVGDHTYFRVEKRGITTHEAARRLAKALGKRPNDDPLIDSSAWHFHRLGGSVSWGCSTSGRCAGMSIFAFSFKAFT